MNNIKLDDGMLRSYASEAEEEFELLHDTTKINILEKYGTGVQGHQICDLVEKAANVYGGIYLSMQASLRSVKQKVSDSDSFFRLYSSYVASQGTKQIMRNGKRTNLTKSLIRSPKDYIINVTRTDNITLAEGFKNIGETALYSNAVANTTPAIIRYLTDISAHLSKEMDGPIHKTLKEKYKNVLVDGQNFKVDGIADIVEEQGTNRIESKNLDEYTKGLTEVHFKTVEKEDVVGNDIGIDLLEENVSCLMHYFSNTKDNHFDEFLQFILFVGKPGTGKTMLARYAMTYAKEIAQNDNLPLGIVKLDFADRYQMGPGLNLKEQFTQISEGNMPYIVFVDEIDKKFPSNADNKEYMEEVLCELLKFRGESEYPDRNNYIMIGTTNNPSKLHDGVIDVFTVEEINGPVNTEQRLKVLYNHLKPGIDKGYVQINDDGWSDIAQHLKNTALTGRQLKNVARSAGSKYRKMAKKIQYSLSTDKVQEIAKQIISKDNSDYLTNATTIIKSIKEVNSKTIKTSRSFAA